MKQMGAVVKGEMGVEGEKAVAKSADLGIIEVNKRIGGNGVRFIGKLDKEIYSCVTEDITTDEVVITDTQVQHIKERHPGDYERFFQLLPEIISEPDYILEANKPNTAFVLKKVELENVNFQLILRLKTSHDPSEFKNSVITFLKVDERKWRKYLRNKKILYRRE